MRTLLLAGSLFLACGGTTSVYVDNQRDVDGAWSVADDASPVFLETTDNTLTIRFKGRTFVFPEMSSFRGGASPDAVTLRGDIAIHIDEEVFAIDAKEQRVRRPMSSLPPGKRITWTGGALLVE